MGHLATPKHNGHFGFMTILQKAADMLRFKLVVVLLSFWPQLDFFDADDLLLLLGLLKSFALLILVLAKIHDPAHRRLGIGSHLNQIQASLLSKLQRILCCENAELLTILIYNAHFTRPNQPIDTLLLRYSLAPPMLSGIHDGFSYPHPLPAHQTWGK